MSRGPKMIDPAKRPRPPRQEQPTTIACRRCGALLAIPGGLLGAEFRRYLEGKGWLLPGPLCPDCQDAEENHDATTDTKETP